MKEENKYFELTNKILHEQNKKEIQEESDLQNNHLRQENQNSQSSYELNRWTVVRGVIVSVLLILIIMNTAYGFVMKNNEVTCFNDMSFENTKELNQYFAKNKIFLHLLLIVSSFCVDLNLILMGLHWILFGKSIRLFIILFLFYFARNVCQQIFQMRYPENYLWEYPGFPSLSVSYLKTNDFFYSGHIGFPTIFGFEHWKLQNKVLMIFCIFTALLEAFTMIISRGHYSIDLITGFVMGHYLTIIGSELSDKYIDNLFLKIRNFILKNHSKNNSITKLNAELSNEASTDELSTKGMENVSNTTKEMTIKISKEKENEIEIALDSLSKHTGREKEDGVCILNE